MPKVNYKMKVTSKENLEMENQNTIIFFFHENSSFKICILIDSW